MANYQSIPARFNPVTSSINHKYIDSTLKEKQGNIDMNYGFMSETVDKVLGQDLYHEEDREYLKNKVAETLNTMSNSDNINFDSNKARYSIQDGLNNAIDNEILTQIGNTRKIRAFNAEVAEAKKKGTFNQVNYQGAMKMAGLDRYMLSSKEGRDKNLGNLTYVPYYDAGKEVFDHTKDIMDTFNKEETRIVQDPNNPESFITVTERPLTPAQVENMVSKKLSSKAKYQMAIEGGARFNYDNNRTDVELDAYAKDIEQSTSIRLKTIEKKLSKEGISPKEKRELTNIKNLIERDSKAKTDQINNLKGKGYLAVGRFFQQQEYVNNMLPDDYGNSRITKIQKNEVLFAKENLKLKQQELNLKIAKEQRLSEESKIKNISNQEIASSEKLDTVEGVTENKLKKGTVPLDELHKDIENSKVNISKSFNFLINSLPKEQQEAFNVFRGGEKSDYISDKIIFDRALEEGIIKPEPKVVREYNKSYAKLQRTSDFYNKDYDENEKLYKEVQANSLFNKLNVASSTGVSTSRGIKGRTIGSTYVKSDGTIEETSQLLSNNNIKNGTELNAFLNTDEGKELNANLIVSKLTNNVSESNLNELQSLKSNLGFQGDITEDIITQKRGRVSTTSINNNTPFGRFVSEARNRSGNLSDITKKYYNPENSTDFRDFRLNNTSVRAKVPNDKMVIIPVSHPSAVKIQNHPGVSLSNTNKENLYLENSNDPNYVDIYSKQKAYKGTSDDKTVGDMNTEFKVYKVGRVLKTDLQHPDVLNSININEQRDVLEYNIEYNSTSKGAKFYDEDNINTNLVLREQEYIQDVMENVPGTNQNQARNMANLLSSRNVEFMLNNQMNSYKTPQGQLKQGFFPENINNAEIIKSIFLDSPNYFKIKVEGTDLTGRRAKIVYQNDEMENHIALYQTDIPNNKIEGFNVEYESYPQLFIARSFKNIINDTAIGKNNKVKKVINQLNGR